MIKFLLQKIVVFFFMGVSSLAFSSSVSILMSQYDNSVSTPRKTTYLIENGIMDVLYDSGVIVSSVPVNINTKNEVALNIAIQDAKNGYFMYAVHVSVYYKSGLSNNPKKILLEDIKSIDWEIVRISDKSFVYEEKNILPLKYQDESDILVINRFAKDLGIKIQNVLNENN